MMMAEQRTGAHNMPKDPFKLSRAASSGGMGDGGGQQRPKPTPYISPYEHQQSIAEKLGKPGKMVPAFAHVEAKTGLVTF